MYVHFYDHFKGLLSTRLGADKGGKMSIDWTRLIKPDSTMFLLLLVPGFSSNPRGTETVLKPASVPSPTCILRGVSEERRVEQCRRVAVIGPVCTNFYHSWTPPLLVLT